MATIPEAKQYMETLLYITLPCPESIRRQGRCNGCGHPRCRGFGFDEGEYQAAWLRLRDLGTEEVFADLNAHERAWFWFFCLAVEHLGTEQTGEGPHWTGETACNYLYGLVMTGELERFINRFRPDPILEYHNNDPMTFLEGWVSSPE